MAEREKGNLPAARTKVRIIADAQSVGLLLHGSNNGAFDLAFAPGLNNDHLQPEATHRGLRLLDVILREARIVRIHEDGNPSGARKNLVQKLQPFGGKLDSHKGDSRDVSSRTIKAGCET